MRKRLDIVCHAFPSWRGDYLKSTVQLMKELAVNHNVLYVDYAYSIKDILLNSRNNNYIPVKRILGLNSTIEKVQLENGSSLNVLSLPPIIPFNWINNKTLFKIIQKINNQIINFRITSALKNLNMISPVIINAFNPFFDSSKIKIFKQNPIIYYCYDNISASAWASKHGGHLEFDFIKKTNAVVFTSEELSNSKSKLSNISFIITNGVDLRIFEKEMQKGFAQNTSREIKIGYIGSIDDRLDYDLLIKTITRFPLWKFHFIGRIVGNKSDCLKKYDNVIFYGAVDPKELPVMIKNFNAGIIPFVKNEFTKNIYPMKANEYLALGLPVVMTNFTQLNDLSEVVSSVDASHFDEVLLKEIESDSIDKKEKRRETAIKNSWKKKSIEFETILLQYA